MRTNRAAVLTVACITGILGLAAPTAASAAGSTIYVNPATGCTDTGTGTQAAPFCTIQLAVDTAQPGQTVQVATAHYSGQVTLTHSGMPGQPITIKGGDIRDGLLGLPLVAGNAGGTMPDHGFVLDGVHDVKITGFGIGGTLESVLLTNSQQITLDGNILSGGVQSNPRQAELRLTGTTSGTTVSRNILKGLSGSAVVVDAGVTGTTLTTNAIDNQAGGAGIRITDAPGTIVTSNTVSSVCGPAIALLGNSSQAVVENNVLATSFDTARTAPSCGPSTDQAKLSVSAGSVSGTVADYNLANPFNGAPVYEWAGTTYATAAGFAKAVPQQGAHDLTADPRYLGNADTDLPIGPDSPAIDSADANAPGELATDLYGYHRIDDPYRANTGTGPGFYDRGAFEYTTSARSISIETQPQQFPAGAPIAVTLHEGSESWSPVVSYTYDFGDGSPTITTTQTSVQHTYQAAGSYLVTVVAAEQNGDTTKASTMVWANQPGPLVPKLTVSRNSLPLGYDFSSNGSTSPWSMVSYTYDFGDGSAPSTNGFHTYANEGDYTVTLTITDAGGRTAKTSQVVHVAYPAGTFHPTTPMRLLDTRHLAPVAPGGTLELPLLPDYYNYFGYQPPTAVVLNVTAVSKGQAGHVTVYPAKGAQPTTSSVNYIGGQAVPNLVTVPLGPTGAVAFANSWGSDVDLVVDIFGFYGADTTTGSRFSPLAPTRLVDTRNGDAGGRIGPTSTRNIKIAGHGGVPANATSVVLNLTGTGATEQTHLDVSPGGYGRSGSSNLNPVPGQDRANQVIVPLGPDGSIDIYNNAGSTDFVLDVFGYYSPDSKGLFTPTTPKRLLDTRNPVATLGTDGRLTLPIGGSGNVPANATGAVLNVTSTDSTSPSFVTVFPDGQTRPGTSNLNTQPGVDVPNQVTTPLGTNGAVDIYNHLGSDDIVADLFGYFTNS